MLEYLENYGPYSIYIEQGNHLYVNSIDITKETWKMHINSILNIFRDGIELDYVRDLQVNINFGIDAIPLSVHDYYINLIMWQSIISINDLIQPHHIFFDENITKRGIKNYIDKFIINPNRRRVDNISLNNLIDDTLYWFNHMEEFSLYLANTINLEDDIALMNSNPEAYNIYNSDITGVPLDEVKHVTTMLTESLVSMISADDSQHCLADNFRTKEGVNIKQYKEYAINVGTKPDGKGGVLPIVINNSFINGGLTDASAYFVESSAGRIAQILAKTNVGDAGYFARLLGLNNSDAVLHKDPNYVCDSKHFEVIIVKNHHYLRMLQNQYYRMNPNGVEYLLKNTDAHLLGQTIYLRSPIKCASKSRGEGICYRCYGELAYTNNDINVGKIAAELLSAILTQILLSAKHLLESMIKKLIWQGSFFDFFILDANIIKANEEYDFGDYQMMIDPENITLEDEYDDFECNEFITEFEMYNKKTNASIKIFTSEHDNMYISGELNDIIRSKAIPEEGKIIIDMKELTDLPLLLVRIENNELSRTLGRLKAVIDKSAITNKHNSHSILQEFLDIVIEGNLEISGVHAQVLISNQLRTKEDILIEPRWEYPNTDYQILTLKQSLSNHPSIVVAMSFERLTKTLYNPLTFRKNRPSYLDLFFMVQPQEYVKNR